MSGIEDTTARVTEVIRNVDDPLWKFELAALAASSNAEPSKPNGKLANGLAQIAASIIALITLGWLILRHGGTSPDKASDTLNNAKHIAALHSEDTTRTRHLRGALVRHDEHLPILLLGRPASNVTAAFAQLDPNGDLKSHPAFRPLSLGSYLRALANADSKLVAGIRQTAQHKGTIAFRDRVAIAYRIAQGAVHAVWWSRAAAGANVTSALFGHTGNADTSQLEQAMHHSGTRTAHVVHGANIGWPFAGLSNVAIFPSGADAKLGASLPAYDRCTHLPLTRPAVSAGDGNWALLTSYTHLQHPAYEYEGSGLDRMIVERVRAAAERLSQDPQKIFWRPHPQIDLVEPFERGLLEKAITEAGFSRWPDDWPYERLSEFSAAITTPSTVLTDALRLGQPAIVANVAPLQRDLLYSVHPLLVGGSDELSNAITRVLDQAQRGGAFDEAWKALEPGARYEIESLFAALDA